MALNGKYVKIERVIESLQRDYRFNTDVDWIDILEWIGECLAAIGAPQLYVEKVTDGNVDLGHPQVIKIENYRGVIPADVVEIIQIRRCPDMAMMKRSTDSFHQAYYCHNSPDNNCSSSLTYKANSGYIFTNFEEGEVQMAYKAFATDERGYPMIPDNQRVINACKLFIAEKIAMRLWLEGKLDERKYSKIEQDKLFAMPSAETGIRTPSYDQMENWKNSLIRLIPDIAQHGVGFKGVGNMEQRFNSNLDG